MTVSANTTCNGENLTTVTNAPAPAPIGDYVWKDTNDNGIQDDGPAGISGITVKLYTGDGTYIKEMLTDDNGYYLFDKLVPGDYYVKFIIPNGWEFTFRDMGADNIDSDAHRATEALPVGQTIKTTLDPGENDLTWDAGVDPVGIGDYVWWDVNRNGTQDDGEPGVPGVTVELYWGDNSTYIKEMTTDANGYYYFDNLMTPGSYYVRFILPPGWEGFTGMKTTGLSLRWEAA